MGNIFATIGRIEFQDVDAIVIWTNPVLQAAPGISEALLNAAGDELGALRKTLEPCNVGAFIVTPGFNLTAKWIIHAVTPNLSHFSGNESATLLALNQFHRDLFLEANRIGAKTIAISLAVLEEGGLPNFDSINILIRPAMAASRIVNLDIRFVAMNQADLDLFTSLA